MPINIVPLAEQPQHIDTLAHALHAEWHDFAPWQNVEKIRAYYARCLEGSSLPLAWLAVDGGRLLGSAALKRHDIAALPQYEYWLGGTGPAGSAAARPARTLSLHARCAGGVRQIRLARN